MLEVIRTAHELQHLCLEQGWRFCFIGGLALQRWGEPRETIDVDLTLLTGFGGEDRSSLFVFPTQILLRTCSAEDLIVMKAFAARAKDWIDVEGMIVRQTGRLDWAYIRQQLRPLAELKVAPEILDELERRRLEFEK